MICEIVFARSFSVEVSVSVIPTVFEKSYNIKHNFFVCFKGGGDIRANATEREE